MRPILMLVSTLALLVVPAGPTEAQPRPDCRELKRACDMKDQLGEKGEGNCRRFRALCGRDDRDSERRRCEQLRRACMFKGELGERGEGNCRRYREECRDR